MLARRGDREDKTISRIAARRSPCGYASDADPIFELAPVAMVITDFDGRLVRGNLAFRDMLGYTEEQMSALHWSQVMHPEDKVPLEALARRVSMGEMASYHLDARCLRSDGEILWTRQTVSPFQDPTDGRMLAIYVVEDVGERMRTEDALRTAEAKYRALAEELPVAAYAGPLDEMASTTYISPAVERMFGYSRQEWTEDVALWVKVLHPDDRERVMAEHLHHMRTQEPFSSEYRVLRADGEVAWVRDEAVVVEGSAGEQFQHGVFIDVTDQKRAEEALRYHALHDELTGLPNRALLNDRLQQSIYASRRNHGDSALFLLDLDGFKEVNDTLGHHSGDLLLQEVGTRLRAALRETDTVARLGGDEFAVVIPLADREAALEVVARVHSALNVAFDIGGQHLHVAASIGIALCPHDGETADVLLQHADVAMYVAKRLQSESRYAFYDSSEDLHSPTRLSLASELRHAIEDEQLVLHYQPKISMKTRKAHYVEALVRWQHPRRGLVLPDQFIRLAEETGLITPLTRWVLREALTQCKSWRAEGWPINVSVNLSAQNLHDQLLVETVSDVIRSCGAEYSWLTIEITETALMTDPARAMEVLVALHAMGVEVAIDDFGTGYSSLAYIKRLPVDEIKIDRSFVMDSLHNDSDRIIVHSVIDLGHNLGIEVTAEGIEDEQTWNSLAAMECDMVQGYYVSRPLSALDVLRWYQSAQTERAVS
jgi:diguanylate cyclase (GGDEF)-like protein/PAS domain S-box-containing protein